MRERRSRCLYCRRPYTARRLSQWFCSPRCRLKRWRQYGKLPPRPPQASQSNNKKSRWIKKFLHKHRRVMPKCVMCRKEYFPARLTQKYCSTRCRVAAWRRQRVQPPVQPSEQPPVQPSEQPPVQPALLHGQSSRSPKGYKEKGRYRALCRGRGAQSWITVFSDGSDSPGRGSKAGFVAVRESPKFVRQVLHHKVQSASVHGPGHSIQEVEAHACIMAMKWVMSAQNNGSVGASEPIVLAIDNQQVLDVLFGVKGHGVPLSLQSELEKHFRNLMKGEGEVVVLHVPGEWNLADQLVSSSNRDSHPLSDGPYRPPSHTTIAKRSGKR